jgi:hypothetical protein
VKLESEVTNRAGKGEDFLSRWEAVKTKFTSRIEIFFGVHTTKQRETFCIPEKLPKLILQRRKMASISKNSKVHATKKLWDLFLYLKNFQISPW